VSGAGGCVKGWITRPNLPSAASTDRLHSTAKLLCLVVFAILQARLEWITSVIKVGITFGCNIFESQPESSCTNLNRFPTDECWDCTLVSFFILHPWQFIIRKVDHFINRLNYVVDRTP
jgi:hypothetical protein